MSQSPITHDPGKPTPPDSPTPAGVPAPSNGQAAPVEHDPCLILTDRYPDAVAFAATLHAKQSRKGGDIPYISHLLGVSSLIIEARGDEDQAIAGLLHDAAEDCGGEPIIEQIRWRYGNRVANAVEGCSDSLAADPTKKAPWKIRKQVHLGHLQDAGLDVLIVTAADKLHNARAIWNDVHVHGEQILDVRFTRPARIGWYYRSVLAAIDGRAPKELTRPLAEVVGSLADLLDRRYPAPAGPFLHQSD